MFNKYIDVRSVLIHVYFFYTLIKNLNFFMETGVRIPASTDLRRKNSALVLQKALPVVYVTWFG